MVKFTRREKVSSRKIIRSDQNFCVETLRTGKVGYKNKFGVEIVRDDENFCERHKKELGVESFCERDDRNNLDTKKVCTQK